MDSGPKLRGIKPSLLLMRKFLLPLLVALSLPTSINASGFWLLTTTVKKPAAFKEYVQEFKPWLKSVGGSLVMKDSDPKIVGPLPGTSYL